MRRFAFAAAAVLSLMAGSAAAQDKVAGGWYGTVSAAALMPRDTQGFVADHDVTLELDNGYAFYGAAGYRFGNGFRAEGELGYGNIDFDRLKVLNATANLNGDVDIYTLTGAVYYDFINQTAVTPYLGAGAGLAHQRVSRTSATAAGVTVTADGDSATDLTAFAELGASINFVPKVDLVPSYRYQWINDGEAGLDDTTAHVLKLGVRYWF